MPGAPWIAEVDDTATSAPPSPVATRCSGRLAQLRKAPSRLTRRTRCHSARLMSTNRRVPADAGVGEQRVDPAQVSIERANAATTCCSSATSHANACDPRADRLELGAGLRVLVLVAAPDHDVGTRVGERPGHAQPDAPVAAGDDHDLDPSDPSWPRF